MTLKDWKSEAFQMHLASHQLILEPASLLLDKLKETDPEFEREFRKIMESMHTMYDSVLNWVKILSDENLKLQGALEEARRNYHLPDVKRGT